MNRRKYRRIASALSLPVLILLTIPAFAQVDLSGQWAALNHNDNLTRGPGPDLVDYTGLPLNDEGRAVGLSYSSAVLSMTKRGCTDYTEDYITFAPHNIMIERENDPVTGENIAWKISAGGSDRAPEWCAAQRSGHNDHAHYAARGCIDDYDRHRRSDLPGRASCSSRKLQVESARECFSSQSYVLSVHGSSKAGGARYGSTLSAGKES